MKRKIYIVCLCILCSCQPKSDVRGNVALTENMDKFVVGKTTATEVVELCGSPSLHKDNFTWIYVTWKSEEIAFKGVQNKNESIIRVTFDNSGILKSIDKVKLSKNHNVM